MAMRLFKRNGVLYADFIQKGKRFKKSLDLADTPANRKYATEKILPTLGKPKKRQTLGEFIDIVLEEATEKKPATAKAYEYAKRQILNYFEPKTHIAEITTSDIDDFVKELKRAKLAPKTIKAYLAPLSLAFKEALRLDVITKNPVTTAKTPSPKPQKKKDIFTKQEIDKLLQNSDGMLKTFMMIGFYTGARAGEIISLKWNDIKENKMTIARTRNSLGTLNTPKNDKSRTFKIAKPLEEFLGSLEKKSEWIVGEELASPAKVARRFKRIQKNLNIEPQTPHAMRHTTVSLLLSAGENPMLIKNMIGHVDMKMIETIYGHHIENERDLIGFTSLLEHQKEHQG